MYCSTHYQLLHLRPAIPHYFVSYHCSRQRFFSKKADIERVMQKFVIFYNNNQDDIICNMFQKYGKNDRHL